MLKVAFQNFPLIILSIVSDLIYLSKTNPRFYYLIVKKCTIINSIIVQLYSSLSTTTATTTATTTTTTTTITTAIVYYIALISKYLLAP
jgi:hypothetical protein